MCPWWKQQGKISVSDIKNIAKELGVRFTDAEIHLMLEEADRDGEVSLILKTEYMQFGRVS